MKTEHKFSKQAGLCPAWGVRRNRVLEMLLGAVCPPLLTITAAIFAVWLEDLANGRSSRDDSQILTPLMIPGAVSLAVAIFLDLRAIERLFVSVAADVRATLAASSFASLAFLAVWVTATARQKDVGYAGETVLFLCLPTLLICAVLWWFTARAVKRVALRALLLTGFVLATVWVEWQCQAENRGATEERVFMMNSLLVALAVAVRLCIWGATEFARPVREAGS